MYNLRIKSNLNLPQIYNSINTTNTQRYIICCYRYIDIDVVI